MSLGRGDKGKGLRKMGGGVYIYTRRVLLY